MAGCDGAAPGGRLLAAWLPLTAGRAPRRGLGRGRLRPRQGRPAARRHLRLRQPARPGGRDRLAGRRRGQGHTSLGSLAAFGPDGSIPLTLALTADKGEVQPLDDNAFTLTLRNPNAGERRRVASIAVDHAGVLGRHPGHDHGPDDRRTERHRHGRHLDGRDEGRRPRERASCTSASPTARASASRRPRPRPARRRVRQPHRDRPRRPRHRRRHRRRRVDRRGQAQHGDHERPDGRHHQPQPRVRARGLQGGRHQLRVPLRRRGLGAVRGQPAPARPAGRRPLHARGPRAWTRSAPTRRRPGGRSSSTPPRPPRRSRARPAARSRTPRPSFFFSASETGARFECRLEGPGRPGAWFACESPYRPATLADGDWTFAVKALDAAGNEDATPATAKFTLDTTPPVTVIDGITAKVLPQHPQRCGAEHERRPARPSPSGADGAAALNVACPADADPPATAPSASPARRRPRRAAQVRAGVPDNAVTLARGRVQRRSPVRPWASACRSAWRCATPSSGSAGWPSSPRSTWARAARSAAATSCSRPTRARRACSTPAARSPSRRARRGCGSLPAGPLGRLQGHGPIGTRDSAKFTIKAGTQRNGGRPDLKSTKRGKELSVLLKTRLAPAKRLTLTL